MGSGIFGMVRSSSIVQETYITLRCFITLFPNTSSTSIAIHRAKNDQLVTIKHRTKTEALLWRSIHIESRFTRGRSHVLYPCR